MKTEVNYRKIDLASKRIKEYIAKCGYTFTLKEIIEDYIEYWVGDWYVSYTANDVISKYLIEFRVLTGIYTNRK